MSGDIAPSVSKLFGPWANEAELVAFLSDPEVTGEEGVSISIPDATISAFVNASGGYDVKIWEHNEGIADGRWRTLIKGKGVIHIAGVIEDPCTSMAMTTNSEATSKDIYYIKEDNRLGYMLENGTNYYPVWKNYADFGSFDNDHVKPYDGQLYVTDDGQMYLGTTAVIDEDGGGSYIFNSDQLAAINSGITAELVAELQRLKDMNIRYDSTDHSLTLTDKNVSPVETNTYDLENSGTVITYGTPDITVSYGTIASYGDTVYPEISVSQVVYTNGEQSDTLEYDNLTDLAAALKVGDSITFGYATDETDRFSQLNSSTGEIEALANTGNANKEVDIVLTVKLNGMTGTGETTVVQSSSKLYVTGLSYERVNVSTRMGSTIEVTPNVQLSNGTTETLATYLARPTSEREELTLSRDGASQGESFDSSTGEISYTPSTILTNLDEGETISKVTVVLEQDGRQDIKAYFAMIDYADTDFRPLNTLTQRDTLGGSATLNEEVGDHYELIIQKNQTKRSLVTGLAVSEGDIIVVKIPDNGAWYWIWETSSIVPANPSATITDESTAVGCVTYKGFRSSSEVGAIVYKVKSASAVLSIGWQHGGTIETHRPTGYLKVDTSGW